MSDNPCLQAKKEMRTEKRKITLCPHLQCKKGKKKAVDIHINSQSSIESQHQKQGIYMKPFGTLWTLLMAFVLSSLAPECPGRKRSECAMLSLQDMLLDRVLASAGFIFFSDPRAAQVYYCVLLCNTREAGTIPQTIRMKRWMECIIPQKCTPFPSFPPKRLLKRGKTWSLL